MHITMPQKYLSRYLLLLSCSSLLFFWAACDENPPFPLNLTPDTAQDTTYMATIEAAQTKNVLVEDFTGVQCVNCPKGHETLKNLEEANAGRVIGVSIHAGDLSDPLPNSDSSFVLPQGAALYNLLGVEGLPAAAINRVHFPDQDYIAVVGSGAWTAKVNEELLQTQASVNLHLDKQYDPVTRQLSIVTQLNYSQTIASNIEHRISVYIVEGGIIDPQETTEDGKTFIIEDYEHNSVLRQMVTFVDGSVADAPDKAAGRVVVKTFNLTLPANIDANHCHIIAFVQEKTTDSQAILQVQQTNVQ
jgi:hypothetical protein